MRINFEAPPEMCKDFSKIPFGMKSEVLRRLCQMVIDIHKEFGLAGVGAIISGDMKLIPVGVQSVNNTREAVVE